MPIYSTRKVCLPGTLLCLALGLPCISAAQAVALSFKPVDSEYSLALDRVIMVSTNPNQLHIYDPPSNSDVMVNLSKAPLNLSVSPDGLHAAVMHDSLVSYVNLSTALVEQTFTVAVRTGSVALSQTYAYVLSGNAAPAISIPLNGGQQSVLSGIGTGGKFNSQAEGLYLTTDGFISPNTLLRYDTSGGALAPVTTSPHHGEFYICGNVWFSPDGSRVYTGCGSVLSASTDAATDRTYVTSFSNLPRVQALDESAALKRVAVAPPNPHDYVPPAGETAPNDNEVRLYESEYLSQVGRFEIPDFVVGSGTFQAHVKSVFFNQASSSLFVISEADATSGLLNDFAVETIPLQPPVVCNATFGASNASAAASGEVQTVLVNAGADCTFSVQSQASWIVPVSGQYGSGDGSLTYIVRPNLTAQARTGTLSLGSTTFTVTQQAAGMPSSFNALSFEVAAADYSSALNQLVLASASSNEIHIYDPLSHADQIVPLIREPLSLSVGPDGTHAAVGHDGWISYVNLQTATVEKILPVPTHVAGVSLAGKGYIYAFPQNGYSSMQSVDIASGSSTALITPYIGNIPRLYPLGEFIYLGNNAGPQKLDISAGPAQVGRSYSVFSSCANLWLTEDGTRMFTACGTVYTTSPVPADDFVPNGTLSGVSGLTWAAESPAKGETAVIPAQGYLDYYSPSDTELQIFRDSDLTLLSQTSLPPFAVNGSEYAAHGKFLFWDSTGSNLFAVMQADNTAGLTSDFAVYTFSSVSPSGSCAVSFNPNTFQGASVGGSATVQIETGLFCPWSAQSDSSWLTFAGQTSGGGAGQITLIATQNSTGSTRAAHVAVGGSTLTVIQEANSVQACVVSTSASSLHAQSSGGPASVKLSVDQFCNWDSQIDATWLTVAGKSSGTGPATLTFIAAPNFWLTSRTATVNLGQAIVSVTQDADSGSTEPAAPAGEIDFGKQGIGVPAAPQRVLISPASSIPYLFPPPPFAVDSFSVAPNSGEFSVQASDCSAAVSNYFSCTLTVAFRPQGFGQRSAVLTYSVNGTPATVALSGFGVIGTGPQAAAFVIQNRLSGMVLDATDLSMKPGTQIQQWDAMGTDSQKWRFVPTPDGYFIIKNDLSGLVLDVTDFSAEDGALIQEWTEIGSDNQKWSITSIDGQYFEIVNKLSGKALDVTNFSTAHGTLIQQWQYAATQNQQWQLIPAMTANAPRGNGNFGIPSDYTTIVNRLSGKVLDVTNFSTDGGALIQQWDSANTTNQEWQLVAVDSTYYKILSRLSGKVLDVQNFSTADGAPVQQWDYEQSENQLWKIVPVADQYFKIVNKLSGKVLDVTDFSTADGAKLQQWSDAGSTNQEWSFSPVSE